jgi:hypothetical protein
MKERRTDGRATGEVFVAAPLSPPVQWSGVMYLVFSQTPSGTVDASALVRSGERFFQTRVHIVGGDGGVCRVHLERARPPAEGRFEISTRVRTLADLVAARAAEERGRAAGMSALAERCPFVWEIRSDEVPPPMAAWLTLSAICASVALGPVLPPDGATLFGVRGALERAERYTRST